MLVSVASSGVTVVRLVNGIMVSVTFSVICSEAVSGGLVVIVPGDVISNVLVVNSKLTVGATVVSELCVVVGDRVVASRLFERVVCSLSVVTEGAVVDSTFSARGVPNVVVSFVCAISTWSSSTLLSGVVLGVSVELSEDDTVTVGSVESTSFCEGSTETVELSDIATVVGVDCTVSVVTSGVIDDDSMAWIAPNVSFDNGSTSFPVKLSTSERAVVV